VRREISDLLIRWQAGEINERDVHETAEAMWEQREWPHFEKSQDDSIAVEALMQLDALPSTWITVEDVPAFLEFLGTPSGKALEGWSRWMQYWDSLDFDARGKAVGNNPLYSPVHFK
jgi:hypothetical protein